MSATLDWGAVWARFSAGDLTWPFVVVAVLAAVIYARCREDRGSLRNTLLLCVVSVVGLGVAAFLDVANLSLAASVREAFVVIGGLAIIRLWGQFIFRVALPLVRIRPPRILEDLVVIAAYCGWGLVRLRYAGLDLSGIVATSAVMTAIVAFAMQDTLGNILGGVALELDAGFEIGDWIMVDDVIGQVVDIRWRSVSIQTRNWETAIIPNSHMVRSKVLVLGRRHGQPVKWRRSITFAVSHSAPPARVISVIEEALRAANIANMAAEPPPNCVIMGFEQSYARYALRYWLTDLAADDTTDSAVREHVVAALQRGAMRLAVPEHSVHVVTEDNAHAEQVLGREIERRTRCLRSLDLFTELTDEECRVLAERLTAAPFAKGDVITRQGAVAHWLYILAAGTVDVVVEHADAPARSIANLQGPTVFGEMGLLTGEPRRATIVACTAVDCYRLDKAALHDILLQRPGLAACMSRVVAQRQSDFERVVRDLVPPSASAVGTHFSDEILLRIRKFFGIAGT